MKKIIAAAFYCVCMVTLFGASAYPSPDALKGWKLVWSDEFDGTTINDKNWSYDLGYGPLNNGWGNGGVQNYTNSPENAYVKDGALVIKAVYLGGKYNKRNYTSARLITKGKYEVQYGKIAARIKAPYGKGIWPAFWILGANEDKIGWPQCGEIDIFEMFGGKRDDTLLGTMHYYVEKLKSHQIREKDKQVKGKLADDFHVYEIEWNPEEIIWRMDGEEYHREDIDLKRYPERSGLHNKAYIILNIAVGGSYYRIGYPNETTKFPQAMEVDWVRVYKRQ